MNKALARLSLGLIITIATLSCGGTTRYYLLTTTPKNSESIKNPVSIPESTPYLPERKSPSAGISSGALDSADMPYPITGDYADLASMGSVIYSYNTSSNFHDTISFYKSELSHQGYRLIEEHNGNNMAVLSFEITEQTLNITITLNPETQIVNVMIIES